MQLRFYECASFGLLIDSRMATIEKPRPPERHARNFYQSASFSRP